MFGRTQSASAGGFTINSSRTCSPLRGIMFSCSWTTAARMESYRIPSAKWTFPLFHLTWQVYISLWIRELLSPWSGSIAVRCWGRSMRPRTSETVCGRLARVGRLARREFRKATCHACGMRLRFWTSVEKESRRRIFGAAVLMRSSFLQNFRGSWGITDLSLSMRFTPFCARCRRCASQVTNPSLKIPAWSRAPAWQSGWTWRSRRGSRTFRGRTWILRSHQRCSLTCERFP